MDKPSLPKGTRDFGPATMAKRQFILENIKNVFQKYGFQPLETPAMENLTTLTGKYGDEGDQLLFRILNSGDFLKNVPESDLSSSSFKKLSGQIAEKGLRYDLTVPFARYVVMNRHEISFPFKRYQIQPVWRADNPQKGRYREFYQCDADVVGTNSLLCETEIVLMIKEVMKNLGVNNYSIKINHRDVLNGVAELIQASGKESELFVAIDKLEKIGEAKVREELIARGFQQSKLDLLFDVLKISGRNSEKLNALDQRFKNSKTGLKGVNDLKQVFQFLNSYNSNEANVELDLALARGLSYYTGCIFEVKINNVSIGSVSGGGRYDNLTGSFGDKNNLSGVGFSFGVDRLYDALEELKLFPTEAQISSNVLVCHFDEESFNYGITVLAKLREANIPSEIFPDLAKIKKQLDYANKKLIPFTIVIGSEEIKSGQLTLKNMNTGEQEKLNIEKIIKKF